MVKSKRAREAVEVNQIPIADLAEGPAKKRKRSDDVDGDATEVKKSKKDKKDKDKKKHGHESRKDRKEKKKDLLNLPEGEEDEDEEKVDVVAKPKSQSESKSGSKPEVTNAEKEAKKKERKERKKKAKEEAKANKELAESKPETTTNADEQTTDADAVANPNKIELEGKKESRHIVFVGNLPFSATQASITAHFSSLSPISVRCLQNKNDKNPCKGIAFVEFGRVWHMRTCLDKFHHSMFDDGISPSRRINVELT